MATANFVLLFLFVFLTDCFGQRVVESPVGRFSGEVASDGDYYQFLGIPYGQVDPLNPFGAAVPHPIIDGTFEANNDSNICPQLQNDGTPAGSLNCLRLNIYVPTSTATAASQLPVMVYIHAGFFASGSAMKNIFNPRFLVRHDVIIVSIHYRLGPYGFMCLNRRAVPGNQGLKDQVLALDWVKNNIQAFGGNPNQVTLFGFSAGAHSIDLHLLSEQEPLYNRVILQSGSSLAATVIYEPDREAPIKLASHLGLPAQSIAEALSYLAKAEPLSVVTATSELSIEFKPCAETKFENVEAFITEYWINSPVPKAHNMPVLIGFAEYEHFMKHYTQGPQHFQGLQNLFYDYLNQTFKFDDERITRMEEYVRRFYLGDDTISQEFVWPIINFESDYVYNHPVQRTMRKYIQSGAVNIFYYLFTYAGGRNTARLANLDTVRASHGDDLRYIIDTKDMPQQISAQDQVMIDRMTTMWTNFAKYNDPTPEVTTLLPIRWIPIDASGNVYHYLKIDSDMVIEQRPFNRRMAFWDLFYKLNDDYQKSFHAIAPAEDVDDGSSGTMTSASWINMLFTLCTIVVLRN